MLNIIKQSATRTTRRIGYVNKCFMSTLPDSGLVECVPNFSEGQDENVINAIAEACRATPGCNLVDVDPGYSTNRTVFTFVGTPAAAVEGAINMAKVAKENIDMATHKGEHPRFGAMDVCPFVPIRGATMDTCVDCANEFGRRMDEELNLSVYMYEHAAKKDYRRFLPDIRQGEYEAISSRITQDKWKPDYGPAEFNSKWGVTASGARKFLVAYNINLLGTKQQAIRIALNLREQGRGPGKEGRLGKVKGIGWYVDEYNMAQISFNLLDTDVTSVHEAFEAVKEEAEKLDIAVVGSEIVGLIPLQDILKASDYYMEKENLFITDEEQRVRLAIERMGLNSCAVFKPEERIIDYVAKDDNAEELASMSVRDFVEILGARTAAPGGGSAAALVASMGAGLGAMMGWMTFGSKKWEALDGTMRKLIGPMHDAMMDLIPMIDADTDAFTEFVNASRLPKNTPEEIEARDAAMEEGLKTAIRVPLKVMEIGDSCWNNMEELAKHGNMSSVSDLEVGARSLELGIWGAYRNVVVNMKDINDERWEKDTMKYADEMVERAKTRSENVLNILEERDV